MTAKFINAIKRYLLCGLLCVCALVMPACGPKPQSKDCGCGCDCGPECVCQDSGDCDCGCQVTIGEYSQVKFYDELFGNARNYSADEFADPELYYRMLPVIHKDGTVPGGVNEANLRLLKELGYGGVVTNVSLTNDYLENEFAWEVFDEMIETAVETLGMRVWLYDEYYYPSGGARDKVLKDNPEWQAQGLSVKTLPAKAGASVQLSTPKSHTLVSAAAYKGSSMKDIDLGTKREAAVSGNGQATFTNDTGDSYLLVCLYSKNWYEGTHPQYNIMESRRFIDLLRPEPVQKFLNVTYDKYKEHVGKYFNNGIESFFFDEPAMPGTYFNESSPLNILDVPDATLERLDTVNYSGVLGAQFQKDWGYDMQPYLPYLYHGGNAINTGDEALRFRWHYNSTIARLVAENYFGQIGSWCAANNINSSGHMLAEETLASCAILSGNMIRNYSRMQIPGIDMLHGEPGPVISQSNVMKTASSAAEFDGKQRVFCEVSDWGTPNSDWNARIAAVAVQYAAGINTFVSYYEPLSSNKEGNRLFTDATARMGYMLDGGISEKSVAVYYPMEGIYATTTNASSINVFNTSVSALSNNYLNLTRSLFTNQIDYLLVDADNVLRAEISDGALVTPAGQRFTTFIVPQTLAIKSGVMEKIKAMADAGVRVVFQNDNILCESASGQSAMDSLFSDIRRISGVSVISGNTDVINYVKGLKDSCYVKVTDNNVIAVKHQNKDNSVYFLTNTKSTPLSFTVLMSESNKTYRLWNATDGTVTELSATQNGDWAEAVLILPAYNSVFITAA